VIKREKSDGGTLNANFHSRTATIFPARNPVKVTENLVKNPFLDKFLNRYFEKQGVEDSNSNNHNNNYNGKSRNSSNESKDKRTQAPAEFKGSRGLLDTVAYRKLNSFKERIEKEFHSRSTTSFSWHEPTTEQLQKKPDMKELVKSYLKKTSGLLEPTRAKKTNHSVEESGSKSKKGSGIEVEGEVVEKKFVLNQQMLIRRIKKDSSLSRFVQERLIHRLSLRRDLSVLDEVEDLELIDELKSLGLLAEFNSEEKETKLPTRMKKTMYYMSANPHLDKFL
jgi:hypothetical protein